METLRLMNPEDRPVSDTEHENIASLWHVLTLHERLYLCVRHVFDKDVDAARYIGRDKYWLHRAKKRQAFQSLLARKSEFQLEIQRLLAEDLKVLFTVGLAKSAIDGKLGNKERLSLLRFIISSDTEYSAPADDAPSERNFIDAANIKMGGF